MKISYVRKAISPSDKSLVSLLKEYSKLLEKARSEHMMFGSGNIGLTQYMSYGESHCRWEAIMKLTGKIAKNITFKKTWSPLVEKLKKNNELYLYDKSETGISQFYQMLCTINAAKALHGGNCAQTADLMTCLVLRDGLKWGYDWVHCYRLRVEHMICVVGHENRKRANMNEYIVLDPWLPFSQICLFQDYMFRNSVDDKLSWMWSVKLTKDFQNNKLWKTGKKLAKLYGKDLYEKYVKPLLETRAKTAEVEWSCKHCGTKYKTKTGHSENIMESTTHQDNTVTYSYAYKVFCKNCYDKEGYTNENWELKRLKKKDTESYKAPWLPGSAAYINLGLDQEYNYFGTKYNDSKEFGVPKCKENPELKVVSYGWEDKFWLDHVNKMRKYATRKWQWDKGSKKYNIENVKNLKRKLLDYDINEQKWVLR